MAGMPSLLSSRSVRVTSASLALVMTTVVMDLNASALTPTTSAATYSRLSAISRPTQSILARPALDQPPRSRNSVLPRNARLSLATMSVPRTHVCAKTTSTSAESSSVLTASFRTRLSTSAQLLARFHPLSKFVLRAALSSMLPLINARPVPIPLTASARMAMPSVALLSPALAIVSLVVFIVAMVARTRIRSRRKPARLVPVTKRMEPMSVHHQRLTASVQTLSLPAERGTSMIASSTRRRSTRALVLVSILPPVISALSDARSTLALLTNAPRIHARVKKLAVYVVLGFLQVGDICF